MTHMYFSARAEGRISYGHLGRTSLFYLLYLRYCIVTAIVNNISLQLDTSVLLTAINSHVNCSKVVADVPQGRRGNKTQNKQKEREGEFFLILCGCPL